MIKYLIFLPLLFSKLYAQTPDSVRVLYDSLGNQTTEIYYTDTMPRTIEEAETKIIELELSVKDEREKVTQLEKKFNDLGLRGKAKLYYSLNRNMSDISDMLDKISFAAIKLDDKDDKTMERLKMLWASVKPLAETLNILEMATKISGDEKADTASKNVLEFAQPRS